MKAKQVLTGQALHMLFAQARGASFTVTYSDGTTVHYGDSGPQFRISFRDDNIFDLLQGDILMNVGEAYMNGRVEVEGDLADLVSLALRSGLMSDIQTSRSFTGAALRAASKLRSVKQEKENIAHHYDLGNDFFRLWLDDSLTYSCAYFRSPSDTLEQAQQQKIDHSLKKLRLQTGETLLDIGCGWGALVMRAAEHFNVNATGITLSEEQHAGTNAAIKERGLQDKVSVRLLDYGAMHKEGKQFDKIISIGMIEHVGAENLAGFAQAVEKLLKPGGLAMLHLITGVKERPISHWLGKYIFPGGYIPTVPEMLTHLMARDFRVWDVENLGPHYRLTLDCWSERFERVVPVVREQFDERFVRMWRLYLRASSAAFREGIVEVHQILVSRGQPSGLPLTREDI